MLRKSFVTTFGIARKSVSKGAERMQITTSKEVLIWSFHEENQRIQGPASAVPEIALKDLYEALSAIISETVDTNRTTRCYENTASYTLDEIREKAWK